MAEAREGKREAYFVDAAHFVMSSFLGWIWCSTCQHVRAATGRQRYNVLGALNAVYSPNLNLIERLWKFVKKEVLHSRHHQDFKKFQEAIDGCLADMPTKHGEKLATLMTHNFQTWENVSLLSASSIYLGRGLAPLCIAFASRLQSFRHP